MNCAGVYWFVLLGWAWESENLTCPKHMVKWLLMDATVAFQVIGWYAGWCWCLWQNNRQRTINLWHYCKTIQSPKLWYHGRNLWYHGPESVISRKPAVISQPEFVISWAYFAQHAKHLLTLTPGLWYHGNQLWYHKTWFCENSFCNTGADPCIITNLGWGWVQLPCPGCAWLWCLLVCMLTYLCVWCVVVVVWLGCCLLD